jgi:hypothetical protein
MPGACLLLLIRSGKPARLCKRVERAAATAFPEPGADSPVGPAARTRTHKRAGHPERGESASQRREELRPAACGRAPAHGPGAPVRILAPGLLLSVETISAAELDRITNAEVRGRPRCRFRDFRMWAIGTARDSAVDAVRRHIGTASEALGGLLLRSGCLLGDCKHPMRASGEQQVGCPDRRGTRFSEHAQLWSGAGHAVCVLFRPVQSRALVGLVLGEDCSWWWLRAAALERQATCSRLATERSSSRGAVCSLARRMGEQNLSVGWWAAPAAGGDVSSSLTRGRSGARLLKSWTRRDLIRRREPGAAPRPSVCVAGCGSCGSS